MQKELVYNLTKYPFDKVYQTANGIIRGATVKLNKVTIGPAVATDVRASVHGMEMTTSLFRMSSLFSIRGYEVVGGTLILKRY
jgi:aspartyl protease family protein